MINKNSNETTHFGFSIIPKNQKYIMIDNIFHSVASKYDLMNDLLSFGIHRIWKHLAVYYSHVQLKHKVLDLAGGTGDMTAKFSYIVGKEGKVILADINSSMLKIGRNKLRNLGILGNVCYVQTNAEKLPFQENTFDCVNISFGLRNFTEKNKALNSIYQVLKPGGRLLILEFSVPLFNFLIKAYDFYSFHILPRISEVIVGDLNSYQYLVESIRMHPSQEEVKLMILDAGFYNVEYFNMTGGIVVLHRGYKL